MKFRRPRWHKRIYDTSPKMLPYVESMQHNIIKILKILPDAICKIFAMFVITIIVFSCAYILTYIALYLLSQ